MKNYILFSTSGEFFYYTYPDAVKGQEIHGGYISTQPLYKEQVLVKGVKYDTRNFSINGI